MRFSRGHTSKYNLKLKKTCHPEEKNKDYDGKKVLKEIMHNNSEFGLSEFELSKFELSCTRFKDIEYKFLMFWLM